MARRGEADPPASLGDPEAGASAAGVSATGAAALEPLAASVKEAASRLLQLRELNQQLAEKVRELEAHLAAAHGAGVMPDADPAREAEWTEIRRRVEALARHLEQLAASSAPS